MSFEPFIYFGCLVVLACVFFVLVRIVLKSKNRFALLDAILIWPLLLKGPRSRREKYFVIVGILIALLLIIAAQFINK
jgi:hypothetical protein